MPPHPDATTEYWEAVEREREGERERERESLGTIWFNIVLCDLLHEVPAMVLEDIS